jgi:putative ATP-dependent endonuclease of the OLD family
MRPMLSLDAAGALPLTAHGSTTTGVLTAAEAVVSAAAPGAVVLGDGFGDDLDAASAEYLASRLRRNSGQVWLSTRRPEVVRAFPPEEMIRLTCSHGGRRAHQLAATTDQKARAARRYLHSLLLPAMTARTVALLEGPHDLEGYTAVADRRLRKSDVAPPPAYGVRMVAPGNGDGGKDELPKLARLAGELGFHLRVVLDNDKPGSDAALIAELIGLAEHVIQLPEHSSVERALVHGVDASRLRTAFERLVTEHGLTGISVSSIADADLEKMIVKALKSKGGPHQPFVEALPPGKTPPLARKVLDTLAEPPTKIGLVEIELP